MDRKRKQEGKNKERKKERSDNKRVEGRRNKERRKYSKTERKRGQD